MSKTTFDIRQFSNSTHRVEGGRLPPERILKLIAKQCRGTRTGRR